MMKPVRGAIAYPAPAKLNLDLRIIGRRQDGYHELESLFTLIDWCDYLYLHPRADGMIQLHTPTAGVLPEQDLSYRAAKLLQEHTQTQQGVDIYLEKHIPMGGGLGGGSSDAATVLLVLNQLWHCHLSTQELIQLGVTLGADVPFFLFGQNAFAQGIGEQLTPIDIPQRWYVVVRPNQHIATASLFQHPNLTRNSLPHAQPSYQNLQPFRNDMQAVALQSYPIVAQAFQAMQCYGQAQMTGSGSCLFLTFEQESEARTVWKKMSEQWDCKLAKGLDIHPLCKILQK